MRLRRLAVLAFSACLLAILPQASAAAANVSPGRLLTSADIPAALGTPIAGKSVAVTLPAHGRLELCDTLLGSWQVQIAGPATFTQVTIPTKARSFAAVSELAYVFPTTAAAERAYGQLAKAVTRCDRVASGSQPGGGKVTTKITNGSFPGVTAHPQVWVSHRDTYTGKKASDNTEDGNLSVFTQSRNAILVTMATEQGNGDFTSAQSLALGQLAQDLSERWYATAPVTITPAANATTVNLVVGQQARFSGLPLQNGQDLNVTADPKGVVAITRTAAGTPVITATSPGSTKVTVSYDEGGAPVLSLTINVSAA